MCDLASNPLVQNWRELRIVLRNPSGKGAFDVAVLVSQNSTEQTIYEFVNTLSTRMHLADGARAAHRLGLALTALCLTGQGGLAGAEVGMTDFDKALRHALFRVIWKQAHGDPKDAHLYVEKMLDSLMEMLEKDELLGVDLHSPERDGPALPALPILGLNAPRGAFTLRLLGSAADAQQAHRLCRCCLKECPSCCSATATGCTLLCASPRMVPTTNAYPPQARTFPHHAQPQLTCSRYRQELPHVAALRPRPLPPH